MEFLLVTHTQILMPIKIEGFFENKLRPSEGIVALALAMRETMTAAELLKMISDEPRPYNNKYVEVNPFPRFSKLKKKFKSRHWQYTDSRSTE